MADPDDELEESLATVAGAKEKFSEDVQTIIDAWVAKLLEVKESDEDKLIRNEYARTLAKLLTAEGQLLPPFNEQPPEGDLLPLLTDRPKKYTFPVVRLPCARTKGVGGPSTGAIPKSRKSNKVDDVDMSKNEFEDVDEMARIIARSKGQSLAEFVLAVSRHTVDYGQQLKTAMKTETGSFREYVDHVLSQRIKDLTEVLDEEQNAELQRIKKDIDRWQVELSHCKKRVREMIPGFDMEAYKKDKFYLKKVFTISEGNSGLPEDDSFKKWKEETCHRLSWYSEMIKNLTNCNEKVLEEISDVKTRTLDLEARATIKKQNHTQYVTSELVELKRLQVEKDRLTKSNKILIAQLEK